MSRIAGSIVARSKEASDVTCIFDNTIYLSGLPRLLVARGFAVPALGGLTVYALHSYAGIFDQHRPRLLKHYCIRRSLYSCHALVSFVEERSQCMA